MNVLKFSDLFFHPQYYCRISSTILIAKILIGFKAEKVLLFAGVIIKPYFNGWRFLKRHRHAF